ncbi:hypothetical protein AMJ57_04455 [Parcubacteria bacterium SG8_24]|nr:MAG: hypothetical protein AMJ57_04455 [Parcubacteria bacterium SG8_24]
MNRKLILSQAARLGALLGLGLFIMLLLCSTSCCTTSGQKEGPNPNPPTCVPKEEQPPKDPLTDSTVDDGLAPAERLAFIRWHVGQTVDIHVIRYSDEDGVKYAGGTGVVIDPTGLIITAEHVVRDEELLVASFRTLADDGLTIKEKRRIPVIVKRVSKRYDVVLLEPMYHDEEIDLPSAPAAPDFAWRPRKGELVWHFGKKTRWQRGRISITETESSKIKGVVEVAMRGNYGDSGGPVYTTDGRLVGIVLSINGTKKTFFAPIHKIAPELFPEKTKRKKPKAKKPRRRKGAPGKTPKGHK